jgi:hypothetical protein
MLALIQHGEARGIVDKALAAPRCKASRYTCQRFTMILKDSGSLSTLTRDHRRHIDERSGKNPEQE